MKRYTYGSISIEDTRITIALQQVALEQTRIDHERQKSERLLEIERRFLAENDADTVELRAALEGESNLLNRLETVAEKLYLLQVGLKCFLRVFFYCFVYRSNTGNCRKSRRNV